MDILKVLHYMFESQFFVLTPKPIFMHYTFSLWIKCYLFYFEGTMHNINIMIIIRKMNKYTALPHPYITHLYKSTFKLCIWSSVLNKWYDMHTYIWYDMYAWECDALFALVQNVAYHRAVAPVDIIIFYPV